MKVRVCRWHVGEAPESLVRRIGGMIEEASWEDVWEEAGGISVSRGSNCPPGASTYQGSQAKGKRLARRAQVGRDARVEHSFDCRGRAKGKTTYVQKPGTGAMEK
jgi:hypothetical protein